MPQFVARSKNVEVNGETVLAFVDGMSTLESFKKRSLEVLAEKGIKDPKPGKWYPQQAWLDAFKEIATKIGDLTLFQIGQKIPENARFPPEINTIEKALSAIDMAYHMNHRGGEIGKYGFQSAGPKSAKMVCDNPYPCNFDKGIIECMAKKFKPKDSSSIHVSHDDTAECRKKGANSCTYLIKW
jgi:hypothetical protein